MNTSSVRFVNLMRQYPSEAAAIDYIQHLFDSKGAEFGLEHIYEKSKPSSTYVLASILMNLVDSGLISKSYRVVSPSDAGGIGDFDSIDEIPTHIYDPRSQQDLDVVPALVKVIYKSNKG